MLSLPGGTLPPKRGDTQSDIKSSQGASDNDNVSGSSSGQRALSPLRRVAPAAHKPPLSPSSSVFIPRTSRTSTGFKKPVSQMNTAELQTLIERNEGVLSNEALFSKLKEPQRQKLEEDLEIARRRMERWFGWQQQLNKGASMSVTPAPPRIDEHKGDDGGDDGSVAAALSPEPAALSALHGPIASLHIATSLSPRENAADVKRRLFNDIGTSFHTSQTGTALLSNTESTSIQTRLYKSAQEEIQQRKVMRGLELMTGLGRRLSEATVVFSGPSSQQRDADDGDEDEDEDADTDEDLVDGPHRYLEGDGGDGGDSEDERGDGHG